jgi:hypothetical protein
MNLLTIYTLLSISDLIYSLLEDDNSFLQPDLKETEYAAGISKLYSTVFDEVNALPNNKQLNKNTKALEYYKAKLMEKLMYQDGSEETEGLRALRGMQPNDSPQAFFNNITYTDIITQLPNAGNVTETPWSGYYWPIRYGVGAVRYSKNHRVNSQHDYKEEGNKIYLIPKSYNRSIAYYHQPEEFTKTIHRYHNFSNYISIWYSPAEKYDFFVGDYNFTLTNMLKSSGKEIIWDEHNDVPLWMGICHGWSVASYMEKRPNKTITLLAADNRTYVEFLPDDIKALASIYWAEANYKSNFAGFPCKFKNISELHYDNNTGLILDYRCFGINPATFHTAVANYVGVNKSSLIFDPMVDDNEIWNHPIKGYNVIYFNPLTNLTDTFQNSVVTIDEAKQLTSNRFINFTLHNITNATAYIVGAKMRVDYLYETTPNHDNLTFPDFETNITYHYVLELDKDLRMVGGEWLYNRHPNYVFGPRPWDESLWLEDQYVDSFNGTVGELRNLTHYSRDKAIKRKSPLKQVIKFIIDQMYNENFTDPGIKFMTDPDALDKIYPPTPSYYSRFNINDLVNYTRNDGPQLDGTVIRTELKPDGRIVRITTRYVNITKPADVPGGIRQPDGSVIRSERNERGQLVRMRYRPTIVRQSIDTSETIGYASRNTSPTPNAANNPNDLYSINMGGTPGNPPANPNNNTNVNNSFYDPYTYNPENDPNPHFVNPNNSSEGYRLPDGVIVRFETRPDGRRFRYIIRPPTPIVPSNVDNPNTSPTWYNNPNTQPLQPQPSQPTEPQPTQPQPTQPSTNNYPRTPGITYQPDGTRIRTVVNDGRITWYITRPARPNPTPPPSTSYPNSNNDALNLLRSTPNPSNGNNDASNLLSGSDESSPPTTTNPNFISPSYNNDNPNYSRYQPDSSQPTSGGNSLLNSDMNTLPTSDITNSSPSSSAGISNTPTSATPGIVTQPDGTVIRTVVSNGRITRYITRPARPTTRTTSSGRVYSHSTTR